MIKVCSLFSGSSGNSIFISFDQTAILIDAGLSGKKIEEALKSIGESFDNISAIFITHEHNDHICGAGILSRRYKIPVYANTKTWKAMRPFMGKMAPENIQYIEIGQPVNIGEIQIKSFPIPHDAACPVGYNLFINGRKLTIATDIGHMTRELLNNFEKSDMVLLESNHDIEMLKSGPYPWYLKQRILGDNGHLCNDIAGKVVAYLAENGTKLFLLGHLSKENNFPELAYQTVCNELIQKKIDPNSDVYLEVAQRDRASKVLYI
ncbi:MAG: MBL fold metallo-hydrolase [Clostridiaceae bacterium]|nr:MBL fold metallo-hydrolase [Clostridiaceae bacterium]